MLRFHRTPVGMAIIKNTNNTNVGVDVGKKESSCTAGGNVNEYSHYGIQYGGSSKKLKIELPHDPTIPFLGIPKGMRV
jgi:hypothetical protein